MIQHTVVTDDIDVVMLHDTRIKVCDDGLPLIRISDYVTYHRSLSANCHGLLTLVEREILSEELTEIYGNSGYTYMDGKGTYQTDKHLSCIKSTRYRDHSLTARIDHLGRRTECTEYFMV